MRTFTLRTDPLTGEEYCEVYLRGRQLLNDPLLNKGSSYSEEERNELGLTGLIRPSMQPMELQVQRTYAAYQAKPTDLERYIYLNSLLDRNETLFYKLLETHLAEMMPIVYTPTVGEACLNMSRIQRRYRGVYITPDNIAQIDRIFANIGRPETRLIVVTDGERILGLGDLGSDGMGIPIGKISLYVAAAGLHPITTLPVCLDVGTNNQRLLDDPLYLGIRRPRMRGEEYERFIERFVLGVRRSFPDCLLQWEDFAKPNAFPLLKRYRDRVLSFNDDIQGTGAVALATLMNGVRLRGNRFADERFCIVGMGSAGVGVAWNIRNMLRSEGLDDAEIRERIYALDMPGLLVQDQPGLEEAQRPFAQPRDRVADWRLARPDRIDIADVVRNAKVTALVGLTAKGGIFDQEVLGALARNTPRPLVLALSNPTSKSECTPLDVVRATDGRGIVATGSPFPGTEWNGKEFPYSQCNNLYIFPGVGLGALVARAPKVTDGMFMAASRALAALVTDEQRAAGLLLPGMGAVRRAAAKVALAVALQARDEGLGRMEEEDVLERRILRAQWEPRYYPYRAGHAGREHAEIF
jgi:malate dehydrogenase (oxaloacetate-decarboxylating)